MAAAGGVCGLGGAFVHHDGDGVAVVGATCKVRASFLETSIMQAGQTVTICQPQREYRSLTVTTGSGDVFVIPYDVIVAHHPAGGAGADAQAASKRRRQLDPTFQEGA